MAISGDDRYAPAGDSGSGKLWNLCRMPFRQAGGTPASSSSSSSGIHDSVGRYGHEAPVAGDGVAAGTPAGISTVAKSLLPARRRLRLDPSNKLYFPCDIRASPRAPASAPQNPVSWDLAKNRLPTDGAKYCVDLRALKKSSLSPHICGFSLRSSSRSDRQPLSRLRANGTLRFIPSAAAVPCATGSSPSPSPPNGSQQHLGHHRLLARHRRESQQLVGPRTPRQRRAPPDPHAPPRTRRRGGLGGGGSAPLRDDGGGKGVRFQKLEPGRGRFPPAPIKNPEPHSPLGANSTPLPPSSLHALSLSFPISASILPAAAMDDVVSQILEKQVLSVAKAVEDKLDEEIAALERLDPDNIEALRERRAKWRALGHGEYAEVPEKEFSSAAKASERLVCHFYRDNSTATTGLAR